MFRAKFSMDQFRSELASMREEFRIVGTGRIRVRELKRERFVSQLEVRQHFAARSQRPFVVVVLTTASGEDAHLDGRVHVIEATERS